MVQSPDYCTMGPYGLYDFFHKFLVHGTAILLYAEFIPMLSAFSLDTPDAFEDINKKCSIFRLLNSLSQCHRVHGLLSGVPDFFDRNKILSGYDLSHYQVPHCIRVFFYFVWFVFFITIFNFILNYVPIVTFWIFTYHKIWILLIIFCFIWSYWIIYFLTCLEVFWGVVS